MDYVQIPIQVAQKAMRFYRPLLPYVKKRIAELRNERKEIDAVLQQVEEPVEETKQKSKKAKK